MKMTVLCAGLAKPHAGWTAIDELAQLLARIFDAELVSPSERPPSLVRRLANRPRLRYAPVETAGGDVLVVVARGPEDLAMVRALGDVRRKFSRIHAFVTDSYFQAGFVPETRLFDSITVTAHEDVLYPAEKYGILVHQLYQGTDSLRWAPSSEFDRDVDLVAFGRTPPSYHASFARRFHNPGSPYLYLHSPLGNLHGPQVHLERGMLFKLLHRTRISLAFNLMVEPQGDRPRSMMVTSRWLESLVAGCIVAGRRPVSRMADEMLSWSGATTELPDDPEAAADALQSMLERNGDFAAQRRINIAHTVAEHDWRNRIADMCRLFGWTVPDVLVQELAAVDALAQRWKS